MRQRACQLLRAGASACLGLVTLGLCASIAGAQRRPDSAQTLPGVLVERRSPRGPVVQCHGETITEIDVRTYPPFVRGMVRKWQLVVRMLNATHVTTKPSVIRNFLLLDVGERCDELRRAESERILRTQPYLASAVVRPEPNGPGRVRLVVETVDEVTIIAGLDVRAKSPLVRMVRIGEGNLMGQGIHASAAWRAGTYGRTGFSAKLVDYQPFSRPYQLTMEAVRNQMGGRWEGIMEHPYNTDLQRVAWRIDAGGAHDYFRLSGSGHEFDLALGSRRTFSSMGGIVRVGQPGRLSLFGASLTQEREDVDREAVLITPDGPVPEPMMRPSVGPYQAKRSARANLLWGVRNIDFLQVTAFDGLDAVQDVQVGVQAGLRFGRSLALLGAEDDDLFIASDIYAGFGTPRSFFMLHGKGEGREDYDTQRWDGVLGSARLAWYTHLAPGHTMLTSAEWSGGWNSRRPFQLRLGERDGGVRGYLDSEVAGSRRMLMRVENRWNLGTLYKNADYGVALFADAGKMWAGDAPFGVDTDIKTGLGVSLLAAVPRESQRLWRVDLAFPVSSDPDARFEVRFSSSNLGRKGWREPVDVRRSREQTVPEGVFNWP